jgi:hypothetical protein
LVVFNAPETFVNSDQNNVVVQEAEQRALATVDWNGRRLEVSWRRKKIKRVVELRSIDRLGEVGGLQ